MNRYTRVAYQTIAASAAGLMIHDVIDPHDFLPHLEVDLPAPPVMTRTVPSSTASTINFTARHVPLALHTE